MRNHVEAASRILARGPDAVDARLLSTANTHLANALEALDATRPAAGEPRLSDAVREAVSRTDLAAAATVSVDPDGAVERDYATVVLTIRNLLEAALDDGVDEVAIDARTTAEGFRVLVRDPRSEAGDDDCVAELPFDVGVAGDATYGIDLFMRRVPNGVRCDAVVAD